MELLLPNKSQDRLGKVLANRDKQLGFRLAISFAVALCYGWFTGWIMPALWFMLYGAVQGLERRSFTAPFPWVKDLRGRGNRPGARRDGTEQRCFRLAQRGRVARNGRLGGSQRGLCRRRSNPQLGADHHQLPGGFHRLGAAIRTLSLPDGSSHFARTLRQHGVRQHQPGRRPVPGQRGAAMGEMEPRSGGGDRRPSSATSSTAPPTNKHSTGSRTSMC